jgi:hypothetical protein
MVVSEVLTPVALLAGVARLKYGFGGAHGPMLSGTLVDALPDAIVIVP